MQKNGPPNIPRKKVCISIGNIDFFAYSIFKNIEISSGQGLVQIKPNWHGVSHVYLECKTKRIFGIA